MIGVIIIGLLVLIVIGLAACGLRRTLNDTASGINALSDGINAWNARQKKARRKAE